MLIYCFFITFSISATQYTGRYSQENFNEDITFIDVTFKDITSSENGGAICIRGCTGSFVMEGVQFYNIKCSNTGGVIFLESGRFNVLANRVCVSKCSTTQNCCYAYLSIPNEYIIQHNYTTLYDINGNGAGIFQTLNVANTYLYNWNATEFGCEREFAITIDRNIRS